MGGLHHRAQLILFLLVVFVPCTMLIAFGVRIVSENREFRGIRRDIERREAAVRARKELLAALNPVLRDEIVTDLEPGQSYRHTETLFVGWSEGDKLALPWEPEHNRVARKSQLLFSQPQFATVIHTCNQVKSRPVDASLLSRCYEGAIDAAIHPAQAGYVRWLWARDLSEAGRAGQAADLYRDLLQIAPDLTDENGVPLRLLAAQSLAQVAAERRAVIASVESVVNARPWLPPMSCYAANDIAHRLAADARNTEDRAAIETLRKNAAARARLLEQAEGLQDEFPSIRALLTSRPSNSWAAFGDDPWLVGTARSSGGATPVIVVRAQDFLSRLAIPGAVRLSSAGDPEGELLGESLPGLKLVFSAGVLGGARDFQRRVLYFAMVLAVAATMFAAYLLWRDLRREVRLSELRTQFVSSVSHELKTPLTAIRMFAETLQMRRCADPDTEAEYLGTIVNECERLSRLVDGVLLFSKAEQNKRTYRFKPMQAADAVQAAVRALEYPLSQHGFRLHINLPEGLPLISADRDALEQAVLNLLSNAMKYSGDARDIDLELYSENDEVVLRVADRGVGIAPEEQSRIFEKFYRVPTKENQLIPGAGLGLALVAQIVKAHGGRVEVQSAIGKGSIFLLRLPAPAGGRGNEEASNEHYSRY